MEPPGQPEDSHPSDSDGASETGPGPSMVAGSSLVQLSLEAACQVPHMCSGVIQQPQQLCKTRGNCCQQRLSLQHSGVVFFP